MSLIQTEITLKNTQDKMKDKTGLIKKTDVCEMAVKALVDTKACAMSNDLNDNGQKPLIPLICDLLLLSVFSVKFTG